MEKKYKPIEGKKKRVERPQKAGERKSEELLESRLCLVRIKVFPENIPFSGNAIFLKGKRFHVFGCHKIRFTEN